MLMFCDPKIKILLREVNKPVFGEDEKIKVNPKFSSDMAKLNLIPQKSWKEMKDEAAADDKAAFAQIARNRETVV